MTLDRLATIQQEQRRDLDGLIQRLPDNSGFSASDLPLKNLGAGVDPNDAITKHQLDAIIAAYSGMNFRGSYDDAETYSLGDVVNHQGSSWFALVSTVGNSPPTLPTYFNTYWWLLAERGQDAIFSGAETVETVIEDDDIIPFQDVSDGNNPKRITVDKIFAEPKRNRLSVTLENFGYQAGNIDGGISGISSCHVHFNQALTYLDNNGGGYLYLLTGDYRTDEPLEIGDGTDTSISTKHPVHVRGMGGVTERQYGTPRGGTRLIWGGSADGTVLRIKGPSHSNSIARLVVDGNDIANDCIDLGSGPVNLRL